MEKSFAQVRNELDDLGYTETLNPECLPLVRRLLGDLKITTESLRKYMKISQQALEERDNLKFGAEPYKCDNAKLIKECNELHLAFIKFKEQHEKVQRDLRGKVVSLESQLTDCGIEKQKLKLKVQELEQDLKGPAKKVQQLRPRSQITISKTKTDVNKKAQAIMATTDSKMTKLNEDIRHLKDEQIQLLKNNEFLMLQLENRDQEIKRLASLLEGGRPTKAVVNDCCYKNIDNKFGTLHDEITSLKREKISLQNQLKESLSKQHEAMRRALSLAERNKNLEEEMKDIDKIALSVEAECNTTVKSNIEKVTRLQDKVNESQIQIQNLEMSIYKLNIEKTELLTELETVKLEKKKFQAILDSESDEKKRLTDRLNNFTIIEQDLNLEIDRLLRLSSDQKRRISELESDLTAEKRLFQETENTLRKHRPNSDTAAKTKTSSKIKHKSGCKKVLSARDDPESKTHTKRESSPPSKERSGGRGMTYDPKMKSKCCCEAGGCIKWMKELLDKEIELRQEQASQQIDALRKEKEFYMKEYHRLLERPKSTPSSSDKSSKQLDDLLNRIKEKDQIIATLQDDLRNLTNEKYALTSRLEAQSREMSTTDFDDICTKTTCKRRNRELDVHREEVKHLERENNSLKSKIQSLSETSLFNEEKMKKAFQEMEEHITRLENERRDLVISQGTNRSNVSHLEDECRILREKLQIVQKEANCQKANYEQLKILHDQTNRALSDCQTQLLRAESEAQSLQSKIGNSHREASGYEREIARLQGDVDVMKSQLTKIDKEKDELLNIVDDKTEKIDKLENELRDKKNKIGALEKEVKELCRKLRTISEENCSNDSQLRAIKQEINALQQDLDNERRCKDIAIQENRRLQDDMTSLSLDCKDARKELEISKRQVEDLKRQLQHYVAEVKRTEDLISQKELQRTEILDQFRSLSQENNVLETTNHTLESEATQTRVQLSVALDHTSDLERKIDNLESIIRSYEKQISELTCQVASMEIQMKQGTSSKERISEEIKHLKELCVKLDNEKDEMKREIRNKEEQKMALERKMDLFTRENSELKRALDKDKDSQDGLERLLNEARQDLVEQRLLNEDLQTEISTLRGKVDELQERFSQTSFFNDDLGLTSKACREKCGLDEIHEELIKTRIEREEATKRDREAFELSAKRNLEEKVDEEKECHCNDLELREKRSEENKIDEQKDCYCDDFELSEKLSEKEKVDDEKDCYCDDFEDDNSDKEKYSDDFEMDSPKGGNSNQNYPDLEKDKIENTDMIVNYCACFKTSDKCIGICSQITDDSSRRTYSASSKKSQNSETNKEKKVQNSKHSKSHQNDPKSRDVVSTSKNNSSELESNKDRQKDRIQNSKSKVSLDSGRVPDKTTIKKMSKGPVKTFGVSNYPAKNNEENRNSETNNEDVKNKKELKNFKRKLPIDNNKTSAATTKIPLSRNKFPLRTSMAKSGTNIGDQQENAEKFEEEEFDLKQIKNKLPPIPLKKNFAAKPKCIITNNTKSKTSVHSEKIVKASSKIEKKETKTPERKILPKPLKKINRDSGKSVSLCNISLGPISVKSVNAEHPEFKPEVSDQPVLHDQPVLDDPELKIELPKEAVPEIIKEKPKFFTFAAEGNAIVPIKKKVIK